MDFAQIAGGWESRKKLMNKKYPMCTHNTLVINPLEKGEDKGKSREHEIGDTGKNLSS